MRRQRAATEFYLLQHLACIPGSVGHPGAAFRLLVASASHPSPAPTDLLALAWGPEDRVRAFNPFLSDQACSQLRQGVLVWLQLCVLEDRLDRINKLASAAQGNTPGLIKVGWPNQQCGADTVGHGASGHVTPVSVLRPGAPWACKHSPISTACGLVNSQLQPCY